jgi:pimeloyl-ACP methyl ester carboxylesterase
MRMGDGLSCPRPRQLAASTLGLLALAAAASAVYQSVAEARDRCRFRPPGRLVELNGRRLHLVDGGTGSPAVVIVPGLGTNVLEFLPLQQRLAAVTRVCAYDRPGLGYSDPPPRGRRTVDDMAGELHQLLRAAGIDPPYLLAGWSMGGIIARRFAVSFPGTVAAMLLVDSAHEDQVARLSQENRRSGTVAYWKWAGRLRAQPLGLRRLAAAAGLTRHLDAEVAREVPPDRAAAARAIYLSSHHRRTMVQEVLMRARSHGQPPSLGSLPLTVLTAAGRDGAQVQMQAELAAISAASKHITADTAGHDMHLDNQDLIVDAVHDLISGWRAAH